MLTLHVKIKQTVGAKHEKQMNVLVHIQHNLRYYDTIIYTVKLCNPTL